MEITSFILGVCAVIVIAMVVGTFVNYMSLKALKEELNSIDRGYDSEIRTIRLDLGEQYKSLTDYVDTLHNKSENDMNEIYRYIDSRMDKMEAKFSNQLASGVEVKNALDKINKVEADLGDFVKMYRNQ